MGQGQDDEACVLLEESVALMRALGDWRLPHALTSLGRATHAQGNPELARSLLEEALISWRKTGDRAGTAQRWLTSQCCPMIAETIWVRIPCCERRWRSNGNLVNTNSLPTFSGCSGGSQWRSKAR